MDARTRPPARPVNMHPLDRTASGAIGAALLAGGARRGGVPGTLVALAGVGMLYRGLSGNCPGYTALGISTTSADGPEGPGARDDAPTIARWTTIGVDRERLDALLQEPDTLPRMMGHFADVQVDGDHMDWCVTGLFGRPIEWQARVFEHRHGERLSWMSEPGAALRSEGSIAMREARAGRGTVVTLEFAWSPPGGALGGAALKLLRVVPEAVAARALQRLKSLAETGEIPTSEHDPSGRHPAAPSRQAPTPAPRSPEYAGSAA